MDHACAHLATLRSYTAYWFTVRYPMARISCLRLAARPTPDDDPAFAVAACSQALIVQYDAASGHNALPIHRDFSLLTMSSALDAGG